MGLPLTKVSCLVSVLILGASIYPGVLRDALLMAALLSPVILAVALSISIAFLIIRISRRMDQNAAPKRLEESSINRGLDGGSILPLIAILLITIFLLQIHR